MDKETLSNYGWIVICVLVLAVMIALATPFGTFVADAVKSTTQGLFDVNQNALNSTGLINIDGQTFGEGGNSGAGNSGSGDQGGAGNGGDVGEAPVACTHTNTQIEDATTATCTTDGHTGKTVCKDCSEIISNGSVITAIGHKYDNAVTKCTECGMTVVEYQFNPWNYDAIMGETIFTDIANTNLIIPETFECDGKTYKVTGLQNGAFQNYTKLISITLPKGITSIGTNTFQYCSSLKSVNIPEGVTTIGPRAFSGCYALTSIVLPDSLTKIDASAFGDCITLTDITFDGTMEQWNAITKGSAWKLNVPATYVQCSDGQVSLK